MYKINKTNEEIEELLSKITFTERQIRIIEYRRKELSIVEMAQKEHCDPRTIDREISKIVKKIEKVK